MTFDGVNSSAAREYAGPERSFEDAEPVALPASFEASGQLVMNLSPQRHGTCGTLARLLAGRVRYDCVCVAEFMAPDYEEEPDEEQESFASEEGTPEAAYLQLADYPVAGCRGCNACASTLNNQCVISDAMDDLNGLLDQCSGLTLVCPVFFAGPPSQAKAFLDRLQPHFWRNTRANPKRPCTLYVVGQGGDPHGYEPLVTIFRSALAVAGFSLDAVHPCIGVGKEDLAAFLDEEGTDHD